MEIKTTAEIKQCMAEVVGQTNEEKIQFLGRQTYKNPLEYDTDRQGKCKHERNINY